MNEKNIDEIIKMLDTKTNQEVSRIKVMFDEELPEDSIKQQYHHGRCDIGSPWAKGTMINFD